MPRFHLFIINVKPNTGWYYLVNKNIHSPFACTGNPRLNSTFGALVWIDIREGRLSWSSTTPSLLSNLGHWIRISQAFHRVAVMVSQQCQKEYWISAAAGHIIHFWWRLGLVIKPLMICDHFCTIPIFHHMPLFYAEATPICWGEANHWKFKTMRCLVSLCEIHLSNLFTFPSYCKCQETVRRICLQYLSQIHMYQILNS